VYRKYGEVGGKLIENSRSFQAKNIGRSNATSAEQQAHQEALAEWIDHILSGYALPADASTDDVSFYNRVKTLIDANGGNATGVALKLRSGTDDACTLTQSSPPTASSSPEVLPMLCSKYTEEPKVLKYFDFGKGVYVQPKLDGIRALAWLDPTTKNVMLCSREKRNFVFLGKLRSNLKKFFTTPGNENIVLDGELYAHTLVGEDGNELSQEQRFSVITGACRPVRKLPHPLENQIQYYVFDLAELNSDQLQRFAKLDRLLFQFSKTYPDDSKSIVNVPRRLVNSTKAVLELQNEFFYNLGYEGIVIRAHDLQYESDHRSLKMRKFKYFTDSEYVITGAKCDDGVDSEYFTWLCVTPLIGGKGGHTFSVKQKGEQQLRRRLWSEYQSTPEKFIGKNLTVRYQELSELGIPRFPVAIAVRDYE
jgi:DNA ligase-1